MSYERPNVLIVDDERENTAALERALKDENPEWQFFQAHTAEDALKIVAEQLHREERIDLLLTDLVMGTEQEGINVLEGARRIDPAIMSILFTAKEKNVDRLKAFECGAFDFVEKNVPGTIAAREIEIKAKVAIQYKVRADRLNFLRRYFDPQIFEQIEKNPTTLNLRSRTITVCFWDIRGFSRLCEILRAHPSLISGFLKEYCDLGAQTIFKNEGIVDKFIGDGIMALFGVLSDSPAESDGALQAVKAAIELRDNFSQLITAWTQKWEMYTPQNIEIGVGCGIHTGEVLVGNVGTQFRDQFTALGAHVNLAARVEARARAEEILVTQTTASRVKGSHALKAAGQISDIKNIEGTFKLWTV